MEKEVIINLNGKKITAPTKPSESTAVFKALRISEILS